MQYASAGYIFKGKSKNQKTLLKNGLNSVHDWINAHINGCDEIRLALVQIETKTFPLDKYTTQHFSTIQYLVWCHRPFVRDS